MPAPIYVIDLTKLAVAVPVNKVQLLGEIRVVGQWRQHTQDERYAVDDARLKEFANAIERAIQQAAAKLFLESPSR